MNNQGWVVVDVETTGYNPDTDRVLSVAAITLTNLGAIEDTLSWLVNPGVDPGPTDIHGLTTDILAGAPQFDAIADDLTPFLDGRILVAHNAAFDTSFLAAEFDRANRTLPVEHRLCTVELAYTLNLGLENLRLATLAQHYNVRQIRPHDALDDATALAAIFTQLHAAATQQGIDLPIRPADSPKVDVFQRFSPPALPLSA